MYNPSADQVSELLGATVESLDIPEELFRAAATEYADLADWLAEHADGDHGWEVYPQGSFRLGTVVRPLHGDEYDVDLVCRRNLEKAQVTQAELKDGVGHALEGYIAHRTGDSGAPDGFESKKRCFMLSYERAFHLDVLPAIPDREGSSTGILLTDRDLHYWQYSDPKAYGEWFKRQMAAEFIVKRAALAEAARVEPEEIPDSEVKTTLQRTIQALKHHRNLYFAENLDERPASIMVTTLAARAYTGEGDLFQALLGTAAAMPIHIERDGEVWSVPNPVQEQENFVDKWAAHPELAEQFFGWLEQLQTDLRAAAEQTGLGKIAVRLAESFGEEPVERAAERLGDRMFERRREGSLGFNRSTGSLALVGAGAVVVKPHDFYGSAKS
jgi:hypothetical protein